MKKLYIILPLTLILCFMVSCQDKEAMAELEAMKAQAAIEEQNKALITRLFEELDKGNAEIINELFASDAVSYSPSGSTTPSSPKELVEMTKMFYDAFPDLAHSIEELIASGDKVIARIIATGTHDGNTIELSFIVIVHIENGKFVEQRQEIDMLGFMQQLGMELKPKEMEK
jgi:predicted ester cyclase